MAGRHPYLTRARRGWWLLPGVLVGLAAMVATVTAGASIPRVAAAESLPGRAPLDYSPDGATSLRRLRPDFVAESLGSTFRAPGLPGVPAASTPTGAPGTVVRTTTYRCVDGRQTEDPLAPPCVEQFTGDNGGATYRGVTHDEVRVLVVVERQLPPGPSPSNPRHFTPYGGDYHDLWQPPVPDEGAEVAGLRLWQDYFNQRYQLYGRRAHLFVYFRDVVSDSRNDNQALENNLLVRPFAVVHDVGDRWYPKALAEQGVVNFDRHVPLPGKEAAEYASHPGYTYGLNPPVEVQDEAFVSYLCQKVVGHPAAISGNPGENGRPRKLALYNPIGGGAFGRTVERIRAGVERCGGEWTAITKTSTGCHNLLATAVSPEGVPTVAAEILEWRRAGVTTIVDPGCTDDKLESGAAAQGWRPEFIVNRPVAKNPENAFDAQAWHRHAVGVTTTVFRPRVEDRVCFRAQLEQRPSTSPGTAAERACEFYDTLRQVFTAFQVAGPRLTPATIEAGLRGLRFTPSDDPQVPQCGYGPGDYTCIEDAFALVYDARTDDDEDPGTVGCWRAVEGGRRHRPGRWPAGNVDAQFRGDEPCHRVVSLDPVTAVSETR